MSNMDYLLRISVHYKDVFITLCGKFSYFIKSCKVLPSTNVVVFFTITNHPLALALAEPVWSLLMSIVPTALLSVLLLYICNEI